MEVETQGPRTTHRGARSKIGVLVLNTKQYIGSVQHVHATLARLLDRERFRVFVATTPDYPGRLAWDDAPDLTVWRVPLGESLVGRRRAARAAAALGNWGMLDGLLRLAARARRERIRIIHTGTSPRDALAGMVLSQLTGAALVLHWHHIFWGRYPLAWRLAFRRARAIVAVSEPSRRSLQDVGVPAEKLRILYNGVDIERYRPGSDGEAVRRGLGIPVGARVVLLPGRLMLGKGQADLLRAVAVLKARGQDVTALVVGDDDPDTAAAGISHRAELERLGRELGIEDRVVFERHRRDMPALMGAADVVTIPSVDDPFPLVVLEALACGRPVIGTRSGGIPEEIEDGRTGLLVAPGDPTALARAIERLLAEPEFARRLGENARREAEARFSHERMARDAGRIYESLLAARPAVRRGRA